VSAVDPRAQRSTSATRSLERDCACVRESLRLVRTAAVIMIGQGLVMLSGLGGRPPIGTIIDVLCTSVASLVSSILLLLAVVHVRKIDAGDFAKPFHGLVCGVLVLHVAMLIGTLFLDVTGTHGQTSVWFGVSSSAVSAVLLAVLVTSLAVYGGRLEGPLMAVRYLVLVGITIYAAWIVIALFMHARSGSYLARTVLFWIFLFLPPLLLGVFTALAYRVNRRLSGRLCSRWMRMATIVIGLAFVLLVNQVPGYWIRLVTAQSLSPYVDDGVLSAVLGPAPAAMRVIFAVWMLVVLWHATRRLRRVGHCLKCGYDLAGSPGARCPECGHVDWLQRTA